jgi:CheY-like chemotaxis protein
MKTVKVLLVEDEAIVAMQTKSELQKMGHAVVGIFASGEDALAGIAGANPELILMDIKLQGEMDGIETAERLSQDYDIPLIFLTAHSEESTIDRARTVSSYGYLLKPVEAQDLHIAIQMAIYRHEQDRRVKQVEESLRESNNFLKTIMNSIDALIYIADIQTHELLFVNKYGLSVWGNDIVGQPCWKALQSLDGPCSFCTNDRLLTSDGRPTGIYRWEFQNLVNRRWYDISDLAIHWTDGRMVRLEIAADITDRKQLETERANSEAQYHQIQKAKSLSRMAEAITHNFNNMLAAVMGNLDLAMNSLPRGSEAVVYLTDAMKATRQAADVSSLMLTYLGQAPGKHEAIDLSDVCRRSLPKLRDSLPNEVILEADLPDIGPTIKANAEQIEQALTKLSINASEALSEGRGTVRLSVRTVPAADISYKHRFPIDWQPQEHFYACMEVADTGCGIAGKNIDELFDPFFSTKYTGRGMGLSVVLGVVRAHNGAVTVKSREKHGSVFRIFFPVFSKAAPRLPDSAAQTQEIEGGGTVLLIEDEQSVRHVAKAMLICLGFDVIEAKDGMEAVELFRKHKDSIRCVLTDLSMPHMDGWETLAALRRLAPGIPVVLSSGYDQVQVMAGDHAEQPQAFLGKPYELTGLKNALARALAEKDDISPYGTAKH